MIRTKILLALLLCLNGTFGFLPTRIDFDDPDLKGVFCDVSGETTDLKAITREGIRREVRNLFNEDPPVGSTGFFVPIDATLSQMFHMYYGVNASATRFYKAVNTIAWANADVDSMESTRYDTRYHFDGEKITEGQDLLANRHNLIVSSLISNQSYDFARQQIGYSLHAIEDFYSHTNYYELGNTEIIPSLGIPGFTIPNVAGPNDEVCTDCSSTDGACFDNVITSGKLTSGFYEYNVTAGQPFIVDKPTTGKCSFGGSLDDSRTETAFGGINKATTSACFSPHANYHINVVEMANKAAQNYLSIIRDTIGNEKFRFLFDLYEGSALVIVIDTTGSMGGEIEAVQTEVAEIVATAPAELYILVPYGDPTYGPVTKTTDSQEFLDAVNALSASGGGDQPEMVWSALNLAFGETPDYSNLYLFTDAGGKDYLLKNGDFALAQDKNIICTTVFSYQNDELVGPPYTNDTDYMVLATVTGGEFIQIDKFTIDNVITIINNGIESSLVSLALRRDVTGDVDFNALVDDTVTVLEITVTGLSNKLTHTGVVTGPTGTVYDLMDLATLNTTSGVFVKSYSETLMDVTFSDPAVGNWNIQASSTETYSITADGASTLGLLIEFTQPDLRPPRPNYKLVKGEPLQAHDYYVEVTLVGWIDNAVVSASAMEFLDKAGVVLSHVDSTEPVDDEFYILSKPLPGEPFYVAISGVLSTGNGYTRLYETLVTPSSVGVEVDLANSVLSATPGSVVEASFIVYNFGSATTYNYYANDEKDFVSSFTPDSSLILGGGSEIVVVTISVPSDAIPWTETTIVVTATAQNDAYIVNSDIAYFIVIPEDRDLVAPTCTENDSPDCSGFNTATTCGSGTWTVTATLHDKDSGLATIYTQPANNQTSLSSPGFVSGTTVAVDTTLTASCCITSLQIIGVDEQGNMGACSYDLGDLDGVLTFEAIDEGSTWVELRWTVELVREDLFKYTLVTDLGFANDVQCFDLVCNYNKTNLTPCSLHQFSLTPYFTVDGSGTNLVPGSTANTEDETLDQEPGEPRNPMANTGSTSGSLVLTWDPPRDTGCIFFYEICYVLAGSANASETTICMTTADTTANITDLEPCSLYSITVASVSKTGLKSPPVEFDDTNAGDAVPGEPENLVVADVTTNSATITWEDPTLNPQCVLHYEVTWFDVVDDDADSEELYDSRGAAGPPTTTVSCSTSSGDTCSATISPLIACTNYSFDVRAVSKTGLYGPIATAYGDTDETTPTDPSHLIVTATGTTSINVTWHGGAETCIEHYEVCFSDPHSLTYNCTDVIGNNYELTGLTSCTLYQITVTGVSPNNLTTATLIKGTSTNDDYPGEVTDLTVVNTNATAVTVTFNSPTLNPQCANEYDTYYTALEATIVLSEEETQSGSKLLTMRRADAAEDAFTETGSGLPSCTLVNVTVLAVSPQRLRGPPTTQFANTLEAVPSAPQNLQASTGNSTTIPISWFIPDTNANCAVSYDVYYKDMTGSGVIQKDFVDRTSIHQQYYEHTITGLLANQQYQIEVNALTNSGTPGAHTITMGSTTA